MPGVTARRANPLSPELVESLRQVVAGAVRDGASVLVIGAQGPVFCAGFDLAPAEAGESDAQVGDRFKAIGRLLEDIRTAPLLTVAACDGSAVGAGADLVAACTVRYASPTSRFTFPGAAMGVCLGTGRLAELVGADRALEWVVTGRWVGSEEARAEGLLTDVVDDPVAAAEALARRAAELPRGTARELARAVQRPMQVDPAEALEASLAHEGLAGRVAARAEAVAVARSAPRTLTGEASAEVMPTTRSTKTEGISR